jgi:hypothetical protein
LRKVAGKDGLRVKHEQIEAPDGNISGYVSFGRVTLAHEARLVQFAFKLFF